MGNICATADDTAGSRAGTGVLKSYFGTPLHDLLEWEGRIVGTAHPCTNVIPFLPQEIASALQTAENGGGDAPDLRWLLAEIAAEEKAHGDLNRLRSQLSTIPSFNQSASAEQQQLRRARGEHHGDGDHDENEDYNSAASPTMGDSATAGPPTSAAAMHLRMLCEYLSSLKKTIDETARKYNTASSRSGGGASTADEDADREAAASPHGRKKDKEKKSVAAGSLLADGASAPNAAVASAIFQRVLAANSGSPTHSLGHQNSTSSYSSLHHHHQTQQFQHREDLLNLLLLFLASLPCRPIPADNFNAWEEGYNRALADYRKREEASWAATQRNQNNSNNRFRLTRRIIVADAAGKGQLSALLAEAVLGGPTASQEERLAKLQLIDAHCARHRDRYCTPLTAREAALSAKERKRLRAHQIAVGRLFVERAAYRSAAAAAAPNGDGGAPATTKKATRAAAAKAEAKFRSIRAFRNPDPYDPASSGAIFSSFLTSNVAQQIKAAATSGGPSLLAPSGGTAGATDGSPARGGGGANATESNVNSPAPSPTRASAAAATTSGNSAAGARAAAHPTPKAITKSALHRKRNAAGGLAEAHPYDPATRLIFWVLALFNELHPSTQMLSFRDCCRVVAAMTDFNEAKLEEDDESRSHGGGGGITNNHHSQMGAAGGNGEEDENDPDLMMMMGSGRAAAEAAQRGGYDAPLDEAQLAAAAARAHTTTAAYAAQFIAVSVAAPLSASAANTFANNKKKKGSSSLPSVHPHHASAAAHPRRTLYFRHPSTAIVISPSIEKVTRVLLEGFCRQRPRAMNAPALAPPKRGSVAVGTVGAATTVASASSPSLIANGFAFTEYPTEERVKRRPTDNTNNTAANAMQIRELAVSSGDANLDRAIAADWWDCEATEEEEEDEGEDERNANNAANTSVDVVEGDGADDNNTEAPRSVRGGGARAGPPVDSLGATMSARDDDDDDDANDGEDALTGRDRPEKGATSRKIDTPPPPPLPKGEGDDNDDDDENPKTDSPTATTKIRRQIAAAAKGGAIGEGGDLARILHNRLPSALSEQTHLSGPNWPHEGSQDTSAIVLTSSSSEERGPSAEQQRQFTQQYQQHQSGGVGGNNNNNSPSSTTTASLSVSRATSHHLQHGGYSSGGGGYNSQHSFAGNNYNSSYTHNNRSAASTVGGGVLGYLADGDAAFAAGNEGAIKNANGYGIGAGLEGGRGAAATRRAFGQHAAYDTADDHYGDAYGNGAPPHRLTGVERLRQLKQCFIQGEPAPPPRVAGSGVGGGGGAVGSDSAVQYNTTYGRSQQQQQQQDANPLEQRNIRYVDAISQQQQQPIPQQMYRSVSEARSAASSLGTGVASALRGLERAQNERRALGFASASTSANDGPLAALKARFFDGGAADVGAASNYAPPPTQPPQADSPPLPPATAATAVAATSETAAATDARVRSLCAAVELLQKDNERLRGDLGTALGDVGDAMERLHHDHAALKGMVGRSTAHKAFRERVQTILADVADAQVTAAEDAGAARAEIRLLREALLGTERDRDGLADEVLALRSELEAAKARWAATEREVLKQEQTVAVVDRRVAEALARGRAVEGGLRNVQLSHEAAMRGGGAAVSAPTGGAFFGFGVEERRDGGSGGLFGYDSLGPRATAGANTKPTFVADINRRAAAESDAVAPLLATGGPSIITDSANNDAGYYGGFNYRRDRSSSGGGGVHAQEAAF